MIFYNNILRGKKFTYLAKGNSLKDETGRELFLQPLFGQAGFGSNHLWLFLKIKQANSKGRRIPKISLTAIYRESKEAPLSCLISFSMPKMCEENACVEKIKAEENGFWLVRKWYWLFPVHLILRLPFQMPLLSSLALPQQLMSPNLLAVLSQRAFTTSTWAPSPSL